MPDETNTQLKPPMYYDDFILAVEKDVGRTLEFGSAGLPALVSLRKLQLEALNALVYEITRQEENEAADRFERDGD